jgi:hypothetical protein
MKNFGIVTLLSAIILQANSLTSTAMSQEAGRQSSGNDNTKVSIGKDLIKVEEGDSSINVRIGNHGLTILESLEGKKKLNWEKFDENDDWTSDEGDDKKSMRKSRFRGHWAGIDFGFNNYVTSDRSMVLPSDIDYMNLHSSKSTAFNMNFSQLSLGIGRHFGFVTGLGFNWNNYKFSGNNNIQEGTDGVIEMLDPGTSLEKTKLTTLYLDLPVLFEIQIPVNNNHLNFAAGPIGGLKLASHTKMKFQDGQKIKDNGDFSLNMLRYGLTARVGYENFQIYGTYYKTPLFKTGKGPGAHDLYPFEIGIAFTFND